jgi:NAD(P)-dependent dehydrogenase (short-subunit alcohol dehydrogenase family)
LTEKSSTYHQAFATRLHGVKLSTIVLNAGMLKYPNRATEISYQDFALHLHTNTIGPIICAQALLAQAPTPSPAKLIFISSDSGSTALFRDHEDGFGAYAASKAALNQMLRHMAAELRRKGSDVCVLAMVSVSVSCVCNPPRPKGPSFSSQDIFRPLHYHIPL